MDVKLTGGHTSSVLCVDALTNGEKIVSGGENGEMCVWSAAGELIGKYVLPGQDCTSIAVLKDRNEIYAAFSEKIYLFDLNNCQSPVATFDFNQEEINQIHLDPKGQYLSACDDSGEIKIINIQDKKIYRTLRYKHNNICSTVCFRPDSPGQLFSGGMDCQFIQWNYAKISCMNIFNMQEIHDTTELGAYMVNPPFVHQICVSPDGKYVSCALENGQITVFDGSRKNIKEIFSLLAHSQGVSQVCFVDNSLLLSAGNDAKLALWDLSKAQTVNTSLNVSNGHTSNQIERRNFNVTEKCEVLTIPHTDKVNWMRIFQRGDDKFVVLADQSCDLTIKPLPV